MGDKRHHSYVTFKIDLNSIKFWILMLNNSDLRVVKEARESYLATVTEGSLITISDIWQYLTKITSRRGK